MPTAGKSIVDWGDGCCENYYFATQNNVTLIHTYNDYGVYTVQIDGPITVVGTNSSNFLDNRALTQVLSFGNSTTWATVGLSFAFLDAINLVSVPSKMPVGVTTISSCFQNCNNLNDSNIALWNTSGVVALQQTFSNCFNLDVDFSNWNTASVTTMQNAFTNCSRFTGKGLSNWNVSQCSNFANMFQNNTVFNSAISGWNFGVSTSCAFMFISCPAFQGSGLNTWTGISNITNMSNMFNASTIRGNQITGWNTSNCTTMNSMLANNQSLSAGGSVDLSSWNISKVVDMGFFLSASNVTTVSLSGWNFASGCLLNSMFVNTTTLVDNGVSTWNTSGVTQSFSTFQGCTNFNANLSGWNTSNIINMQQMFTSCTNFRGSGLENWNTSKINTSMQNMFVNCTNFNANLSGWNVSKVTNMTSMFLNCPAFRGSGLENWNIAGLTAANALQNFLAGTTAISSGQYDLILNSWNANKSSGINGVANWRTDLTPNFGSTKYTSAGSGARAALVAYGWTITDGGFQP
jgi:hypothetical protein